MTDERKLFLTRRYVGDPTTRRSVECTSRNVPKVCKTYLDHAGELHHCSQCGVVSCYECCDINQETDAKLCPVCGEEL